jgi:SET domain-containing protein
MMLIKTFVGPSVIEGVGLFAAEPVSVGQMVYRFDPRFDLEIERALLLQAPASCSAFIQRYGYPHPVDCTRLIIDGDNGRHMNHADEPNTDFRHGEYGFARTAIATGDELTCDYNEIDPGFQLLPSLVERFGQGVGMVV